MGYLSHSEKEKMLRKMRSYCDYQPRSHFDLRTKLYSLKVWKRDVEEIIAQLIEEGYLNEQQFADTFATTAIKQHKWGAVKIKSKLKSKFVSDRCIKDALAIVDAATTKANLEKFAVQKWNSIKGRGANHFVKMRKTGNYLLQKGFSSAEVWEVIRKLREGTLGKSQDEAA